MALLLHIVKLYYNKSIPEFFTNIGISIDQFKLEYKKQIKDLELICNKYGVQSFNALELSDSKTANDHLLSDYFVEEAIQIRGCLKPLSETISQI